MAMERDVIEILQDKYWASVICVEFGLENTEFKDTDLWIIRRILKNKELKTVRQDKDMEWFSVCFQRKDVEDFIKWMQLLTYLVSERIPLIIDYRAIQDLYYGTIISEKYAIEYKHVE